MRSQFKRYQRDNLYKLSPYPPPNPAPPANQWYQFLLRICKWSFLKNKTLCISKVPAATGFQWMFILLFRKQFNKSFWLLDHWIKNNDFFLVLSICGFDHIVNVYVVLACCNYVKTFTQRWIHWYFGGNGAGREKSVWNCKIGLNMYNK